MNWPETRERIGIDREVNLSVQVDSTMLQSLEADIRQALMNLKLDDQVRIE